MDSAVLLLAGKERATEQGESATEYYAAVRALFAQPRKTILNNLTAAATAAENREKGKIAEILGEIGVKPLDRPQNLSIDAIALIARAFSR